MKKKHKNIFLKTYFLGLISSTFLLPLFVYAATTYTQDLFGIFEYSKDIIDDMVLWLFTTGAVIGFVGWTALQIFKLGTGKASIDDRKDINKKTLYGLIALTLMFTFYAVSSLMAVTFGIQIGIPQFFKNQDGLSPGSGQIRNTKTYIDYR